jgi:hypothetical protein
MDSKLKYIHLPKIKGLLGGEIALAYPQITYARQGQRILLITDVLTAEDAQAHKLFQGRMGQTLANIFERAIDLENIVPAKVLTLTTRVVRQQSALSDAERGENFHKITRRICQVIKRWQPDVIVFLGYQKFLDIWRQRVKFTERSYNNKQLMMLRGRLLPAQIAQHNCQIILSFSPRAFASLDYKDAKSRVNLIGFVLYDLATAMRGHNLYTVPAVNKSNCQVIHTIPEFNKFYEQLLIAATPSLDTEGDNLNRVYGNKLFCLLASFDGEFAYLLPLFHPQTPFTSEELEYITDKLRHYFEHATSRYIIFQNAKFDLLMFFAELKIRFCNHRIYDLMAGEYFLDENRKFFSYEQLNGAYSLEFIGAQYGALGYEDSPIAKEDRGRMAEFSLDQIMAYGQMDVCFDPNTWVWTECGPIKIKDLVNCINPPNVASFNHTTNQIEYKPIIASSIHKNKKRMVEIDYEGGKLRVTEDHEIWSITRNTYIKAIELQENEEVEIKENNYAHKS